MVIYFYMGLESPKLILINCLSFHGCYEEKPARGRPAGRTASSEEGGVTMDLDQEIWRAAAKFVERYGDQAPAEADIRLEEMRRVGDPGATDTWTRIAEAVRDILNDQKRGARH